jgi:hypothetical protein
VVEHGGQALGRPAVEVRRDVGLEQRQDVLHQRRPAGHPLVVAAAGVVVGPVEAGARKAVHQPAEHRLVAGVHAQDDLRLAAVAAERALADQEPDDEAAVEGGEGCLRGSGHVFHRKVKRETADPRGSG